MRANNERAVAGLDAVLLAGIERAQEQHTQILARDKLATGHRWEGTPPGAAFISGSHGDEVSLARQVGSGLVRGCAGDRGGCGGFGYRSISSEGVDARVVCSWCNGTGAIWTIGGLKLIEALRAALFPHAMPDATEDAIARFNAEAEAWHEAEVAHQDPSGQEAAR